MDGKTIYGSAFRACLDREKKIFGCHIGCLTGCRKGFSDMNEKKYFFSQISNKLEPSGCQSQAYQAILAQCYQIC
jgi:hypothetical protein